MDPSIICPSTHGSICYSEKYCAEVLNATNDMTIRVEPKDSDSKAFEFSLATLMRQKTDTCEILLTNLGSNSYAWDVVLGSAVI